MSMTPTNPTPASPKPGDFFVPSGEATVHHKKKKPKSTAKMELNMTSMIDVVFQLLIYFIITCEFVAGEGIITANFPVGSGGAPDPLKLEQPIKIVVSSRGETGYRLDVDKSPTAPSTFGDLYRMLDGMREPNGFFSAENPIVIQPTTEVRWQHVVNAFNAAIRAKFKNIAFAAASGGEEGG